MTPTPRRPQGISPTIRELRLAIPPCIVGAGLAPALIPVTGLAPAPIPVTGQTPAPIQVSMGNERFSPREELVALGNERFSPREELVALADEWIAAANDEREKKTLLATREELLAALDLPGDHQGRHYISLDM